MFDNIKPIDFAARRRWRRGIIIVVFSIILAGILYYEFKNFPEESRVRHFFQALQHQDYQQAYQIWQPAASYTFKDFSQDWGPSGVETAGPVSEFHLTGSREHGSGVIVRVQINGKQEILLWVEKKDKSLSFPP